MATGNRDRWLTVFAVCFALLAISNALKGLQIGGERTGFVLFGERLSGSANAVVGPLFAIYQAVYAAGLWMAKRWAVPLAWIYAVYVLANLLLFPLRGPQDTGMAFAVVYAIVALGVSWGAAVYVTRRREQLAP